MAYDPENPWAQQQQPQQQSQAPNWGGNTGTGSNEAVAAGNQAYAQGQRGADPSKVAGYGDRSAWDKWYASQAGGQRPEDMQRFSTETLAGWDQYLVKEGPNAGKYRSMRGQEGFYDKPTECPPGMVPGGPNESDGCIPSGGAGIGGGRGQGGGNAGPGGGMQGGSAWDNPIFQYLRNSGLDASKDPDAALRTFMGQGGAAGYQQQMDESRARAMALPAGPARDAAMADLEKMRASGLRGMRQGSAAAVRGDLQGMLGAETGYAQLGENARQANMQNALGWGGINLQSQLGNRGLDLNWAQFGDQTGAGRDWQTQQALLDRNHAAKMQQNEINAAKPTGFQKVMQGISAVGGILSDIRLKENILPESGALTALEGLPIYSYNYTFDEPEERHLGVMAQDVEKISPHLVMDADGYKAVDLYGLLAVTMGAVKDLSKKVNKIKRGK